MSREFWAARRPGWVVGGVAVATVVMTIWLLRAKSGANTATVLALAVSIASLVVAARGLSPGPPLSRAARELADRVAQERGRARRQALGMAGDARPAEMTFRAPMTQAEPELVRWRSDGGSDHGTLRNVASFYRSLDRGRMVVLGEPGAGKTVLATQLVIDLVEGLPDGELQPGARPPVPVWLSLTSVDLGDIESLARASAEEIAARLDQWIATQLTAVYQMPRPTAEQLIRGRWVLPVLDGLDETDPPVPGASSPSRPRAAAVVRALNAGTGRRPVVLVCRRGEYGQLARSAGAGAEDPVLQDASQIVLQPLDVPAICGYLTTHFPGDHPRTIASRWENVQAALRAATVPAHDDSVAQVLSSPWRLFLAVTAYHDDTADPDEMLRLPAHTVGEHLLGQLIPAVTRHAPRLNGDHYQPDEVRAWLGTLARHLDRTSNDPELHWSPTDLRLERLWPIAGQKTVHRLSTLACAALLGAAFAPLGLLWAHVNGRWYPNTPVSWLGLIGSIATIFGLGSFFLTASSDISLEWLDPRLTSPASRKKLARGLAVGLAAGLLVGLIGRLAAGLTYGLVLGLAVGLAFALMFGLASKFSLAAQPTSIMRQNIAYGMAAGLAFALAFGLAAWLAAGSATGLAAGPAFGLAVGLAVWMACGLAVWIRYVIGCWLARRSAMLPRQVGQFLNWAYYANLLRMSGTAVQFRHREFQAWLVSHPQALPMSTASAQKARS